jgi:hypothetical protein
MLIEIKALIEISGGRSSSAMSSRDCDANHAPARPIGYGLPTDGGGTGHEVREGLMVQFRPSEDHSRR